MNLRLARKNKEADPESWGKLYGFFVSKEFRKKYSADKCEAVINNYLDDPKNEEYAMEFIEMQNYRKHCKKIVKDMMEI
jgi:hypothetical protein